MTPIFIPYTVFIAHSSTLWYLLALGHDIIDFAFRD